MGMRPLWSGNENPDMSMRPLWTGNENLDMGMRPLWSGNENPDVGMRPLGSSCKSTCRHRYVVYSIYGVGKVYGTVQIGIYL